MGWSFIERREAVIPAKCFDAHLRCRSTRAGIQDFVMTVMSTTFTEYWFPAFAGTTAVQVAISHQPHFGVDLDPRAVIAGADDAKNLIAVDEAMLQREC